MDKRTDTGSEKHMTSQESTKWHKNRLTDKIRMYENLYVFYLNYTCEYVNMIYCNLKVHISPVFLCLYPWLFKLVFLKLD